MKKIIVTGGCGYIGSHTIADLALNGYEPVSIDNNSRSSEKAMERVWKITGEKILNHRIDLCSLTEAKKAFSGHAGVAGVIHFAAFKTVRESVEKPLLYYRNNLVSLLNTLECAAETGIPHFVFSSSCSVYGNLSPERLPVAEDVPLPPAVSPYGDTKQMSERIIEHFSKTSPMQFISLRYFNPAGAHESGLLGEVPFGDPENLVPILVEAATGKRKEVVIHGKDYNTPDGTCVRDYIHVMDIAHAHTLAMKYLEGGEQKVKHDIINLGSGKGSSVLEVVKAFEKSVKPLSYRFGPRRDGDTEAIYASNKKAKSLLGWLPGKTLEDILISAWKWENGQKYDACFP